MALASDILLLVAFFVLAKLSVQDVTLARATVESYEQTLERLLAAPEGTAPPRLFADMPSSLKMPLKNEVRTAWLVAAVVAIKALLILCLGHLAE